jgi:ferric-dicitrate binding protein FerR (iron transport regulator)
MKPLTDAERVDLNEWCSLLADGALEEPQRAGLEELLRNSEEARQFYVRAMQLSASLQSYAAEMQSEPGEIHPTDLVTEPAEPANVIRPARWRWWVGPLAAAAIILFGFWLGQLVFRTAPPVDVPDLVARITGGKDCQWTGFSPATGDELAAGQQLVLRTGVAELTFDSGAQLTIEAPATVHVNSAWEAELLRGTVRANVPEEAIGFRVMNAAVEIVDLGTEFSVTANDDGAAEVLVLKGAVEVHPHDSAGNRQPKTVMREKQARRFARAGSTATASEVRNRDEKFENAMRKVVLVRLARPLNYARWSFDETTGLLAKVEAPQNETRDLVAKPNVDWTEGKFGNALDLDGDSLAHAELGAPLRRGVRTIAFWTRVPAGAPLSDAGVFAALPAGRGWGPRIELSWNRLPAEGTFGALRFHSGAGRWVGSTGLRDGRWHHIAVVLGAPGKPGAAAARPPMKLYVDGRLETFSTRHPATVAAQKQAAEGDGKLWLGGTPQSSERFRGAIDELVLTDLPLTPQEIRHLMRTNTLLSAGAIADL